MSVTIGLRSAAYSATNQTVTNSAALVTQTGFTFDIGVSQAVAFQWYFPFTVGATGGIRLQVTTPLLSSINNQVFVMDAVTPFVYGQVITAINTAYTNALAVAGSHWARLTGVIIAGATPGAVSFQFAQNTADPLTLTALAGAFLELTAL